MKPKKRREESEEKLKAHDEFAMIADTDNTAQVEVEKPERPVITADKTSPKVSGRRGRRDKGKLDAKAILSGMASPEPTTDHGKE